jgi:hypothetical protein
MALGVVSATDFEARWRRPAERWVAALLVWLLSGAATPVLAADESGNASIYAVAAGVLSDRDVGLGLLESSLPLTRNIAVTAAPTVIVPQGGDTEYQLRTGVTLLLDLGPFRLDDRNLWVFSDAVTTRYRNRLRLTAPVSVGRDMLRLQLFNEAFYERGGAGWFRNVIGADVGFDLNQRVAADAYLLSFHEDGRERFEVFVLSIALRIR